MRLELAGSQQKYESAAQQRTTEIGALQVMMREVWCVFFALLTSCHDPKEAAAACLLHLVTDVVGL